MHQLIRGFISFRVPAQKFIESLSFLSGSLLSSFIRHLCDIPGSPAAEGWQLVELISEPIRLGSQVDRQSPAHADGRGARLEHQVVLRQFSESVGLHALPALAQGGRGVNIVAIPLTVSGGRPNDVLGTALDDVARNGFCPEQILIARDPDFHYAYDGTGAVNKNASVLPLSVKQPHNLPGELPGQFACAARVTEPVEGVSELNGVVGGRLTQAEKRIESTPVLRALEGGRSNPRASYGR